MLAASGVAGAALAFLPAVIAALVGVLDIGAHAVLGLAGALLGVAGWWLPGGGGGLPAYQAVAVAPLAVAGNSVLRAIGPVLMVIVAWRPPARRPRRRAVALAASAAAFAGATGVLPWLVLAPGAAAGWWL